MHTLRGWGYKGRGDERNNRAYWVGTGKQSLIRRSVREEVMQADYSRSTLCLLGAEQKCEIFKKGVLYVSLFLPFVFSNSNASMGTETSLSTLSCVIPLHPPSLKALSNSYSRPPPFLSQSGRTILPTSRHTFAFGLGSSNFFGVHATVSELECR